MPVTHATFAFVNGKLVICGGYPSKTECYSIGPKDTAWQPAGTMTIKRNEAPSEEINDKMLIFGGWGVHTIEEMDVQAATSTLGPSMPLARYSPCASKINSTTVLIIGGLNSIDNNIQQSTTYYDTVNKIFKPGPDLMVGRYRHDCGWITNSNGSYVVVAGGNNGTVLDSTEYLDLDEPTIWKTG